MSSLQEIRTKISSTKNTQKITSAMEMVAASKTRKTKERMAASKPYAEKMRTVIKHIAGSHSEYRHAYLLPREIKNIGVIVVSSDRGLCGGLNSNLFKTIVKQIKTWHAKEITTNFALIGRKAVGFFNRVGGKILGVAEHLGDKPTSEDFIGVVQVMLSAFEKGEIDALYIAHNEFVNTMTQTPKLIQLLPLPKAEDDDEGGDGRHWDYIYEPDSKELLEQLLMRYIELQVYQAVVENIACEQAARMVAMKSATDNAGDIIKEFETAYNKARQASITQELAEIVGGAAAL